jgi:hypothetical protein
MRLVALLLAVSAAAAGAQSSGSSGGTPVRPPPQQGRIAPPPPRPVPGAQDTTRRRASADTLNRPTLVVWAEDDSVMKALMARVGYSVVRYQSDTVGFDARTRTMALATDGKTKSAVMRDSTLLVARQIVYNDSTNTIAALGDTIVMRDPQRGEDVTGLGEMTYDIEKREGRTREFSTVANSGEDWRVMAHRAAFVTDSTGDRSTVYGVDGIITSCLDSVPHYHFLAKELKRVSRNVIVARPAILYVQDVPVMWLPFIFQDIRSGRRSGMLTPRMGFSEIVRNSPTYRRTAENLGYYFALSDYVDAQVSLDWRSRARETEFDPGWVRYNGELRYRWLDRFMSGQLALSRHNLSTGSRNTTVAWSHLQEFSSRTRFSTNLQYMTNTTVQRQTAMNPALAMATIASQANLVRQQGPFSMNLGGAQRQYPGRDQIDRDFPTLSVASKPLTIGEWFVVTPTLNVQNRQQLNLDAAGDFVWRYSTGPGGLDSTRLQRNTRNSGVTLSTPFKVFDFQVSTDFRFTDIANDFPSIKSVPDPANPGQFIDRVYARTFLSTADYNFSVGLPQFFKGTWNFAPAVSLTNPVGAGSFVRSERTNGAWVSQSKRLTYGVGVSPTFFRLLPGFGPIERMRHAVSPTLSWGYSPTIDVSDEYLRALGEDPARFIGGVAQNRLSLSISTNLEGKMRVPGSDTMPVTDANAPKIRLLSLQFSSLSYDFERARVTGRSGFATDRISTTFRSDLLPGLDLGVDHSLFQGNINSDTAVFKPYRESVRFGFQLTERSGVVRAISRLFGIAPPPRTTVGAEPPPNQQAAGGLVSSLEPGQQGMGSMTGTRGRGAVQELNTGPGFTASFSVSQQRQRPPAGDARITQFDPAAECASALGTLNYEFCLLQAERRRPTDDELNPGTAGGTFTRIPPVTNVGIQTQFKLTPKWAAGWNTQYDVERSRFAMQVVTLQRELHDWRAVFGFTQAPNGNVGFTFYVALKAQPDIKLDYDRRSYRQPTNQTP